VGRKLILPPLTERIARNVGILRMALKSGAFGSSPVLPRKIFADLLFDEEKAQVDYTQLAANPVFNDAQRQLILGLASDEGRHYRILGDIRVALEGEKKLV